LPTEIPQPYQGFSATSRLCFGIGSHSLTHKHCTGKGATSQPPKKPGSKTAAHKARAIEIPDSQMPWSILQALFQFNVKVKIRSYKLLRMAFVAQPILHYDPYRNDAPSYKNKEASSCKLYTVTYSVLIQGDTYRVTASYYKVSNLYNIA
jgi:hypothetical protein